MKMIMNCSSELPWMKINEFLLSSEKVREPKEFCVQVVKKIYSLIPYDQARIYFVNDNGKIYDKVLIGVNQRWDAAYLEYYSKIENGRYSMLNIRKNIYYSILGSEGRVFDWTSLECDEFINDYIKPQGLNFSLGFGLNSDDITNSVYSLDRTIHRGYTHEEIGIMSIIQPHLNNLFKNLFVLASKNSHYNQNTEVQMTLTKRESEIAELLCRGMTPINISRKFFLSLPTIYKHIANIHMKLNVSNRQELLLKLMNVQYIR